MEYSKDSRDSSKNKRKNNRKDTGFPQGFHLERRRRYAR